MSIFEWPIGPSVAEFILKNEGLLQDDDFAKLEINDINRRMSDLSWCGPAAAERFIPKICRRRRRGIW